MEQSNSFAIPFGDILRFILKGLPIALIAAAIIGALVLLVSRGLTAQYEARATVLAARNNPDLRSFGIITATVPTLDVSAYRKAALSSPVLLEAMTRLGLSTARSSDIDAFRRSININTETGSDSSILDITVRHSSPEFAKQMADVMADALVNWDRRRAAESLQRVIITLEQQIVLQDEQIAALQAQGSSQDQLLGRINQRTTLLDQLTLARAISSSATGLLSLLEPSLLPDRPVAPRPFFNAVIASVLTLLLAYGLMHLRDSLSPGDVSSLAKASGLPLLASFPKVTSDVKRLSAEMTNYLRTNLLFTSSETHPKVILVTSTQRGEGKTSVAISLAESFARNNYNTLLVDADLRHPAIAKEYKMLASRLGHTALEVWLKNPADTKGVVRLPVGKEHSMFVIPSFQAAENAAELLSGGFRDCLDQWRKGYDVIVIDSPPILDVADALSMAPFCTDTTMVLSHHQTTARQLQEALDLLKRLGVRVAGLVATQVSGEADWGGVSQRLEDLSKKSSFRLPTLPKNLTEKG